jgi:hypothetical protein
MLGGLSAEVEGLSIDLILIDETRFELSCAVSPELNASLSVVEKDRFRAGERNEAGERDVCLSVVVPIDVMGANRLSSFNEPGKLRGLLD